MRKDKKKPLTKREQVKRIQKEKDWPIFFNQISTAIHFGELNLDQDFNMTEKNYDFWRPLYVMFLTGIEIGKYKVADAIKKGEIP